MPDTEIEQLIQSSESGNADGPRQLAGFYHEPHQIAQCELRQNRAPTLGATTLLHEA